MGVVDDVERPPKDFRERLFDARQRYERLIGRREVSHTEIARLLSARLGKEVPQPNVSRWLKGTKPEDDRTMEELARLFRVSYVWLALGVGSMLDTPPEAPRIKSKKAGDAIPKGAERRGKRAG